MFHLPIMLRSIATTSLMLSHKYRLYLQPINTARLSGTSRTLVPYSLSG
nr:MAG TPA: hypothetical protein [Caudoviricetes sp.]